MSEIQRRCRSERKIRIIGCSRSQRRFWGKNQRSICSEIWRRCWVKSFRKFQSKIFNVSQWRGQRKSQKGNVSRVI